MFSKLYRLLVSYRMARSLLPVAGLALLLLAGCGGQVETAIVVQPDGAWTGEVRLSLSGTPAELGGPEEIKAVIEERAAALLDKQGIAHTLVSPAAAESSQDYTLIVSGQDLQALGQILSDTGSASAFLSRPAVVEISGQVQAGEMMEIALPANPSTGFAWAVEPAAGAALAQVGKADFRQIEPGTGALSRQTIQVQADEGGLATLRLVYRRSWEPETAPSSAYTVNGARTSLAMLLAAVSMPEPAPALQAPLPVSQAVAQPAGATPNLPSYYNWCDLGGCTPVKDQASCGSCWAFSTVGVLESAIKFHDGVTTDLSEQYLVSCNTDDWGCDGGWWAHDYHQWKFSAPETMAGAVPEAEFGYVAWDAPCGGPYSHPHQLTSWGILSPEWGVASVAAIKQAIYDHGPVNVALCAGDGFKNYTGGVFSTDDSAACAPYHINHAVVLVGWNDAEGTWILRNSWGTEWGEGGYMRMVWGTSNVGYRTSYITYVPPTPPDNWVYLPIVLKSGSGGGIVNGDFEDGPTGWTQFSTHGWQLILNSGWPGYVGPHGGSWAVWLGGDYNETSYIQQQVTIPAGMPYLHYWHWIASADLCGYDFAYVRINNTPIHSYNLCSATNTGGWVEHIVYVGAYAGQSVALQIRTQTDDTYNSNLFVDDVSLKATGAYGASPATIPVDLAGSQSIKK